jgi:uncharacterized membrane protein YcaP (DUF421 family)
MVAQVFRMGTPAWEVVVRTALVYVAVLAGFRVLGKREIGQMNLIDLVLLLLIANAVQNAMVGPDVSLQGGLLAAAVLVILDRALAAVRVRSRRFDRALLGQPVLLVSAGEVLRANLRKEDLSEEDLLMAVHEHGLEGTGEVGAAWLENDGSISIVPSKQPPLRSPRRRARGLRKRG